MSTKTISGIVTDSSGASQAYIGTINIIDPPTVSLSITPDPAPAGTLRTITLTANDPQGEALTYTCLVDGVPANPTSLSNVFTVIV